MPCELPPRDRVICALDGETEFDLLVIGAGATGTSVAHLAAQGGCRVALLEARDHGSGTSSRSSKLLHGGVRYLAQGQLGLVRQALRERSHFLNAAPHLAQALPFVIPTQRRWRLGLQGLGLRAYQALAGSASLGDTRILGPERLRDLWPELKPHGWVGAVEYWDAQFEDARMALWLAAQAHRCGAQVLNHAAVTRLRPLQAGAFEVEWRDACNAQTHTLRARCVINATGAWVEQVRALDSPLHLQPTTRSVLQPSQGVHLALRWPSGHAGHPLHDHALLWPSTTDGRVLFFIPWLGHWLIGTTDTLVSEVSHEPKPQAAEVDFLLREASQLLGQALRADQVGSVWAGLRPLASQALRSSGGGGGKLSREHAVHLDSNGLISVVGGKWTTCRVMATDALRLAQRALGLRWRDAANPAPGPMSAREPSDTIALTAPAGTHLYGDEQARLQATPGADRLLGLGLSEAMVRHAVRHEQACTVADVLARRSRMLFLDAHMARVVAPEVARIMRSEGLTQPHLDECLDLCAQYQI
jgi:glycerol-3-phosphate dehydrogenase